MSILQKRSLVAGTLPTTASLLVGELGINVPDGRIFLRKSGSTDTIESSITTGAQNSGSVTLSGSLALYGTSGSVLSVVSDTLEFNGDQMEFTGSFIVSGSTTIIGRLTAASITGSIFGTSSYASNGFPFSGSAVITGSLEVTGSVKAYGLVDFIGPDVSLALATPVSNGSNAVLGFWGSANRFSNRVATIVGYNFGAADRNGLIIQTRNGFGSAASALTIHPGPSLIHTDKSYIGINNINPTVALDVSGSTRVNGNSDITGSFSVSGSINIDGGTY